MLIVTMLAAMGTAPGQLEFHLRAALDQGVSREENVETILQIAVYAGVPACMNAIMTARYVFSEQAVGVAQERMAVSTR